MENDPKPSSIPSNLNPGNVPSPPPASEPAGPPSLTTSSPPPLPPKIGHKPFPARQILSVLLSLCLLLFLADGIVSLLDDSLILFANVHALTVMRGLVLLSAGLMALVIYCLMGVTPMIPKRLFLPITLFIPVAGLLTLPLMIYYYDRIPEIAWALSVLQVAFGLAILYRVQGGFKLRWPLIPESLLGTRRFSWGNLTVFVLVNIFVLLPAVIAFLALSAGRAVDHFTDGFLALRPDGLSVQVRKYVRDDGKVIQLFPMSHVGDSAFYRSIANAFPTNSVTLMEGVTDNKGLLTNKVTYKRMAASLGLSEQHEEFNPRGEMVRADLDIEEFAPSTLELLNMVMLVHSRGMSPDVVLRLTQYTPAPGFEKQLWEDLLGKRNRHLLKEIQDQLPLWDHLIVPWGAAHMPEIAREIQKTGFRLVETQEYMAIRFGSDRKKPGAAEAGVLEKPR